MTDKVYTVLAIDLKFSVEELSFKYDCFLTKIKKIDKVASDISKFRMALLIRLAAEKGYPKPDDQESYQNEYERIRFMKFMECD